jgi:hypothetical protein
MIAIRRRSPTQKVIELQQLGSPNSETTSNRGSNDDAGGGGASQDRSLRLRCPNSNANCTAFPTSPKLGGVAIDDDSERAALVRNIDRGIDEDLHLHAQLELAYRHTAQRHFRR